MARRQSDQGGPPGAQARDVTDSGRRRDAPGTLHHVTNRGVARRGIFENEAEIRFFLSLVARAVRRGWWRVHVYTVLHTHFHLLVRVGDQSLSRTMRWVLFRYARRFNRTRRREGPLFTARFFSRPVRSLSYRRIVVGYIDDNAVAAGLTPSAAAYPHGSARHYRASTGPLWLDKDLVDGLFYDLLGRPGEPGDYEMVFGARGNPAQKWIVERRLQEAPGSDDPIDELLTAPPDRIRSWLVSRATLADGKDLPPPVVTPQAVENTLQHASSSNPTWKVRIETRASSGWQVLRVGLLHDMVRLTGGEIAARASLSRTQVYRRARQHRRLLAANPDYAARCAEVLQEALRIDHGWP